MQVYGRRRLPAWAGMFVLAALSLPPIAAAHPVPDEGRAAAASASGSPWGAAYFPNVPLVTQDGKTVHFFDDLVRGKVVAINFIYTGCGDACPLETARLGEVQQILGERVGRNVFFYSISIDPENDTPVVLKRYAEKFQAGPGWLFLTGRKADVTLLRRKLGLLDTDERPDQLSAHNLSLIVGNQGTGRWQKASPFENPYILANLLGSALHNWKQAGGRSNDYANAPDLRRISRGEELFRTRCASCHTFGTAGNSAAPGQRVGPDLTGVARLRDRAWLTRWLREPDRMLAEKDPVATTLLYNNVAMPSLRLSDLDIDALIAYLDGGGRHSAQG